MPDAPVLLPSSILNPTGVGNVSGTDPALNPYQLAVGNDGYRAPPQQVTQNPVNTTYPFNPAGNSAAVAALNNLLNTPGSNAAQIAEAIAQAYGPYTATNSAANRDQIIATLCTLGGSITYNYNKAAQPPQAPNVTVSQRLGECHDTHTALAAILASLVAAHQDAKGWHAGSPNGQEANVQCVGFMSVTHFITVYRDPGSGRFNSIEYGASHITNSANAIDALSSVYGQLTGKVTCVIHGWDGHPALVAHQVVGAQRAVDFFTADPGVGQKGELRLTAAANNVGGTYFLTKNLSLGATIDPSGFSEGGIRGGVKLNYHQDWSDDNSRGYWRIAGGVYNDFFTQTIDIGDSLFSGEALKKVDLAIVGFKLDRRQEWNKDLAGKHLQLTLGNDIDLLLGVPISFDNPTATLHGLAQAMDFSQLYVGGDVGLRSVDQITSNLSFEGALRLRYRPDLVMWGAETYTGWSPWAMQSLFYSPFRAQGAAALKYQASNGASARLEVGATVAPFAGVDPTTTATENHYVALTVSGLGPINGSVIVNGDNLDGQFKPVRSAGLTANVVLSNDKNSSFYGARLGAFGEFALPAGAYAPAINAGLNFTMPFPGGGR